MRVKCNRSQLDGLVLILGVMLDSNPSTNIGEEIIYELVNKVYIKIHNKATQLYLARYDFTLTDLEAKALWVYYQNTPIDAQSHPYESTQLQALFNQIDKQYGGSTQRGFRGRELAPGTSTRRLGSPA